HVVATAPFVQGPVIVEFQNQRLAPVMRGIDPAQEEKVIPIRKFIKEGQLDLDGESTVLGSDLARILRINVGDKLTIYSPGNLGQILEPPMFAQTWTEMNHQFFEAVRLERNVMFFLLFFIVVVAAFGIMSTLITVTVQKRREIGIVKALGANISQIIWVFLGQGTVVGLFGTLTGLGLGMTLIRYRNEF